MPSPAERRAAAKERRVVLPACFEHGPIGPGDSSMIPVEQRAAAERVAREILIAEAKVADAVAQAVEDAERPPGDNVLSWSELAHALNLSQQTNAKQAEEIARQGEELVAYRIKGGELDQENAYLREEIARLRAEVTQAWAANTKTGELAQRAVQAAVTVERDHIKRLDEALTAWQVRLAHVGHPKEPPDWSEPVRLTDEARAALRAPTLAPPAVKVYVIFDPAGIWELGEAVYASRERAEQVARENSRVREPHGWNYTLRVEEYEVQG